MTTLIQVNQVAKDFGTVPVFQDISFEVCPGRHLALLGPSGCGKSTLLRLVTGLDVPSAGDIRIEGELASSAKKILIEPHERKIGMVFQELALWPNLSALDNVLLGMARTSQPHRERRTTAREVLKICRLDGLENRVPAALSVGQQQRVALARALALRPKLLLLDEPFTGLDLTLKAEIFKEIRRLARDFDLTLLLVTHDPLEARGLTSEALVLEKGGCCEQGNLEDLLANPVSATLRAFVANLSRAPET
ncbi:MAG: ABC transporter ATP-binding protein [Verrucomicrobia bacterium]|nr:MAG: ABC transporter ATP-binding protein [Verrucomicrobiota bacterium]